MHRRHTLGLIATLPVEPPFVWRRSVLGLGGSSNMNAQFFQRVAGQCREMMAQARTEIARRQLRLWAEEFEAEAAALSNREQVPPGIEPGARDSRPPAGASGTAAAR